MKLQLKPNTPAFIFAMVQALDGQNIDDIRLIDVVKLSVDCSKGTGVQPAYLRECFVEYVAQERAIEADSHE